jgi:RNA polymerase sigma-70 factor (ECF subfamily)
MRRWGSATAGDGGRAEDDLALRAVANPSAFPDLFDRYWVPVVRYCFHELGSWEDAEDAAQQTMIEVARALPRFVPGRDGSLRSWVFAIARAKAIDARRRTARRPSGPLPDDPPWAADDPSLEEASNRDWLLGALARLGPDERAVLILRAAELTTEEIARILGISEPAVRQRTKRARDRLRPMLAAPAEGRHG